MPEKKTLKRAEADKRAGKSASTQAGEFVKEQVDKVRAGKHGVRSPKQAIAIGLSEARRAGVDLKAPKKGSTSEATRKEGGEGQRRGTQEGRREKDRQQGVDGEALAHHHQCAEARKQGRRIALGDVEAGEVGGGQAAGREPLGGGEEGCRDEGRSRTFSRGEEGGADTRCARASASLTADGARPARRCSLSPYCTVASTSPTVLKRCAICSSLMMSGGENARMSPVKRTSTPASKHLTNAS
ncbi:hypothetical protein ABIE53_004259 [Burkholderia sp. OAS925]